MRKFVYLLLSVLVAGCFFDNKTEVDPNKKLQRTEVVGGEIYLKDIHGVEHGAGTEALFKMYSIEDDKKESSTRLYRGMTREVVAQSSNCTVQHNPIDAAKSTLKAKEIISVGKLSFTISNSQQLIDLTESDKHLYSTTLKEGMPGGSYKYIAAGKGSAPKFGVLLSMPEDLTKVIVNGADFSTDPATIKKSENVKASWNSTLYDNENDIIMIKILTQTKSEFVDLICAVREQTLRKENGMTSWEIDKEEFKDLALTTDLAKPALIGVFRYHHLTQEDREPLLDLIGMRMYNSAAVILE